MNATLLVLGKELRVMVRDRRLMVGVIAMSLLGFPLLLGFLGNMDRLLRTEEQPVSVLIEPPDSTLARLLAARPDLVLYRSRAAVETTETPYLTVRREGGTYQILADGTQERLVRKAQTLKDTLEAERERRFEAALGARGLSVAQLNPFAVAIVDTSGGTGRSTRLLGALIPYLVVIVLAGNAIRAVYVAVGEKEKNTLASLLVSTAPRAAIVVGKSIAIMAFALFASLLLITGLVVSAKLGFSLDASVTGMSFRLAASQLAELGINVAGLALCLAALIMLLGTFARSQREAGVYTAPIVFVAIALAIFSLSSSQFSTGLYLVPILGNSLAMKDTILGSLEPMNLLLPVLGNLALFALLLAGSIWMYQREEVLFRQ